MIKQQNIIVGKHYPELDGLRALAILLVLWWHSSSMAPLDSIVQDDLSIMYYKLSILGACGVSLFFVLSGFLITGILMDTYKEKGCLKKFYIRRSLRIFPLYYVSLIIITIFSYYYKEDFNFGDRILYYIFYVQNLDGFFLNYRPFEDDNWSFFNHFWSLAVEEQFYMLWPVIFLWVYRRLSFVWGITIMLGLSLLSAYARYYMTLGGEWEYAHVTIFSRADALIMGSMLAYTMKMRNDIFIIIRNFSYNVIPIFSLLIPFILIYLAHYNGLFLVYAKYIILLSSIYSFLLIAFVINRSSNDNLFQRVLCSRFMKVMGRISYGFYMFHILVIEIADYYLLQYITPNYWVYHSILFFVCGAITFLISWLSYKYFEKPILNLKDKYAPLNK